MAVDRRERAMENLAVASAIGFIAIMVAAASLFADSAEAAAERSALAAIGGGSVRVDPARVDDPAFSRVHSLSGGSAPYGAVLSLPTRQGGALRAAMLFRGDGSIAAARVLGQGPAPAWLDLLVGTKPGSRAARTGPDAPDPDAVSGATESYRSWSLAARRASTAVASIAEAAR
jgi:hypothetical protein